MDTTDVLVAGGGAAGLTAAIYARRAGLSVTVLEKLFPGGQMAVTPEISNYPGVPDTNGIALAQLMENQAKALGANIVTSEIKGFDFDSMPLAVETADGIMSAKAVILAMGSRRRKLSVPGEDELAGRGVSYCATCDGNFFRNQEVVVVGGGNTALEDALYLAGICSKVTLIHRRESFRGQPFLERQVRSAGNIKLMLGRVPVSIEGKNRVEAVVVRHVDTGTEETVPAGAVFIAVGTQPEIELLKGKLELDGNGRVVAGEDTKTSVHGVFAAGDIRSKPLYQIVTATADGAVAATMAAHMIRGEG